MADENNGKKEESYELLFSDGRSDPLGMITEQKAIEIAIKQARADPRATLWKDTLGTRHLDPVPFVPFIK